MKRLFPILLASLALYSMPSQGGTANVFCQYIGNLASPTDAQQEAYARFLSGSNIDFGVFYGPTSAANLGLAADGYTASNVYTSNEYNGGRTLVYKTSDWDLIQTYEPYCFNSTGKGWCNAFVLQRKSNGEKFVLVTAKANRFDKASYCGHGSYATGKKAADVKVLVAVPYRGGFSNGKSTNLVDSTLTSAGFAQFRDGTSAGAIFAQSDTTLVGSAAAVSLAFGSEPVATATVTYRQNCTVTFEDWNGTVLKTEIVLEGDDATPPADPARVGHTFSGWSGTYQNVQGSVTLVAQYTPDMFAVRFLDWDGTVLYTESVAYGSDATPPANPTREGWRFTGWQGDYTGITAAVDITAHYVEDTAVTHWVTFNDWDGTQLARVEVVEGYDATPPEDPERTGYTFSGWVGTYTNVQQDETVAASYTINSYTVTFQDWDGTVLKTETVTYGFDATPPAVPGREGYTFTGWGAGYQNVASDATVAALYDINHYTVTFQYADGTPISVQTVEYQGSATKPANPAPVDPDTVFYRWNGSYTSVTADTVVTAVFVNKVIEVGTGAEFAEYLGNATLMGMTDVTLALTNDVSMSGVSYTKPTLYATIDGRGHTVTGLSNSFRLLGDLRGGTVRDIVFKGFHSQGNANRTSIIVSSCYSGSVLSGVVLDDCHWTVPSGSYGTSGFIYEVKQNTLMTNCVMRNCSVLGVNAGGSGQYVGGFVSIASSLRMVDCHFIVDDTNTVAVGDGIHVAGALIGKSGSGVTIERCSNNAHVRVARYTGSEGGAGGLVGFANSSNGLPTITDCANFGVVDATVNYPAGGLVGDVGTAERDFSLTLKNCFNYGDVPSSVAAGGLVGSFRGMSNRLVNDGNSGAITSLAGFAGGLVGRVLCVGDNKRFGFRNGLQAGAVTTESGLAGILVGGIEASTGSGLSMVVSNVVMAGSAAATDGGQTGLLFGGRDTVSDNEMAFEVEESVALASCLALPHYYDKDNTAASLAVPPATMAPSALTRAVAKKQLDDAAVASGWMRWIQGRDHPELALFGEKYLPGLMILLF